MVHRVPERNSMRTKEEEEEGEGHQKENCFVWRSLECSWAESEFAGWKKEGWSFNYTCTCIYICIHKPIDENGILKGERLEKNRVDNGGNGGK